MCRNFFSSLILHGAGCIVCQQEEDCQASSSCSQPALWLRSNSSGIPSLQRPCLLPANLVVLRMSIWWLRQVLCLCVQNTGPLAAAGGFRFVFRASSRPEVLASRVNSQQDTRTAAAPQSQEVPSTSAADPHAVPSLDVDGKHCAICGLPACPS